MIPTKQINNRYAATLTTIIILAAGLFATGLLTATTAEAAACYDSSLWSDTEGITNDQLTNFSRAGYMAGEEEIPNTAARSNVAYNVTSYGAVPDDGRDDTTAFKSAIAAASAAAARASEDSDTLHVVKVPAGIFNLSEPLQINTSNVVISGAGYDQTVLKFKESFWDYCGYEYDHENKTAILDNVRWNEPTGICAKEIGEEEDAEGNTAFSHNRAFIEFGSGGQMGTDIAGISNIAVTTGSNRGDTVLVLENASNFSEGQWILLEMKDRFDSGRTRLYRRVLGGKPAGITLNDSISIADGTYRFVNKITAKDGNRVTLASPLTVDVRTFWDPVVSAFETKITNVGIEDLKIVFPFEEVGKHHHEHGSNALQFSSASNCWISNVRINNSDNPIKLRRSAFCTVENITTNDTTRYEDNPNDPDLLALVAKLKKERPSELRSGAIRGEFDGHHGISITNNSTHILVQDVDFKNRFIHDITTTFFANQNVFSRISGIDLRLDHHRHSPHNNLFTEIDAGYEGDPENTVWKSTGGSGSDHGPQTGAYNTYWNITSNNGPIVLPVENNWTLEKNDPQDFGLKLNFVFDTNKFSKNHAHETWIVEDTNRYDVCPTNLYEAMDDFYDEERSSEPTGLFRGVPATARTTATAETTSVNSETTPTQTSIFAVAPITTSVLSANTDSSDLRAIILQLLERVQTLRAQLEVI